MSGKARRDTSTRGRVPTILDTFNPYIEAMIDQATVEYGTGCWLDNADHVSENQYYTQLAVWEHFNGRIPEDWEILNTCNQYRICYNPSCLEAMPVIFDVDDEIEE